MVAEHYFTNNDKIENFVRGIINPPSFKQNHVKQIQGMAWDLTHIRVAESKNKHNLENNEFSLVIFLTADKGFREILDLFKIDLLIHSSDVHPTTVFHNEPNIYFFNKYPKLYADIINRYSTKQMDDIRMITAQQVDIECLVKNLEEKLLNYNA